MNAFLTGGSGFLGQRLIKHLVKLGWHVEALSRTAKSDQIIHAAGGQPTRGSLNSPDHFYDSLTNADVVIHSAGLVEVWANESQMEKTNRVGTERLVAVAKNAGVKTFVHISAAAVISDGGPIDSAQIGNYLPEAPYGSYAQTKLAAEQNVLAATSPTFRTVVIRPPAIWGVGDMGILPEISAAIRKKQFVWINRGNYRYDTCHVDNVCECIILAAKNPDASGIYFVRDNERKTFRTFIEGLLGSQGIEAPGLSLPRGFAWFNAHCLDVLWRFLHLSSRPPITKDLLALIGDKICIDDGRARSELGYKGRTTWQTGLEELRTHVEYWQ